MGNYNIIRTLNEFYNDRVTTMFYLLHCIIIMLAAKFSMSIIFLSFFQKNDVGDDFLMGKTFTHIVIVDDKFRTKGQEQILSSSNYDKYLIVGPGASNDALCIHQSVYSPNTSLLLLHHITYQL